jgi:ABC-type transport system involved in multi-copper enzyme maturation permease subunit
MNPILHKDALQTLREMRVVVVQALFVMVLGAGVIACWPQEGILSVATRAHDNLFDTVMLGQLVFLVLFVPGAAAVSLVSEVEIETFELLKASRLRPTEILFGKVAGTGIFPTMLLLSALPFVGLMVLRGASSVGELFKAYTTLIVAAVYLSTVALAISSYFRTSSSALVAVYLAIMCLCVAPMIPAAILLDSSSGTIAAGLHYARALSPVAAMLALLRPDWGDFDGRAHAFASLWPTNLIASASVIIVSTLLLATRLSRIGSNTEHHETLARTDASIWRRLLLRKGSSAPRHAIWTENPLFINEGRINATRSGVWCVRLFYVSVLTSMGMALISLYGGAGDRGLLNEATRTVIAFQIGFIALITPVLTSAVISSERERGTFELLRTTRLRPGEIFVGKLVPALGPALLPIVAFLPAYATICYLDPSYISYFLTLIPVLVLATIFCCTAGLLCSAFASQSARATVAGYTVTCAVFFAPVLLAWAAERLLSESVTSWIAMPSPLFVALKVVNFDSASVSHLWSAHLTLNLAIIVAFLIVARIRLAVLLKEG